jgi:hypothetical protein
MAFLDALDLASEAATADVLSSAARPALSELGAGASQADNIQTVKGLAAGVSPSKIDPGVPAQVGALPAVILPFGDPGLNIAAFIGITVLGVITSDLGYNAVTVTIILGCALAIMYIVGKRVFKPSTTTTPVKAS